MRDSTVSSGLTLITTSAFAVVVSESANRNAVNIIAHIKPETRPGSRRAHRFPGLGSFAKQEPGNEGKSEEAAPEHLLERLGALDVARHHAGARPQHRRRDHERSRGARVMLPSLGEKLFERGGRVPGARCLGYALIDDACRRRRRLRGRGR